MRILENNEINQISAGFLQLTAAFVAVFVAPKVINEHRKVYNQWGHQIGEAVWEHYHPYDPNK